MALSSERIREIEHITIGQRTNPLWHDYRKNRFTASQFGKILKAYNKMIDDDWSTSFQDFKKELLSNKPLDNAPPLVWGCDHEDVAIKEYEKQTGLKVQPTGIWIFPNSHFAASPDGLVLDPRDPTKIIGCLEIKCPWRLRNFKIKNNSDWNTNLDYLDRENNLYHSHPYYHQIQGEIFGTNLDWCDFAVWCPSGILIRRIILDKTCQLDVLPELEQIYTKSFIREEDCSRLDYVRNLDSMEEINLGDVLSLTTTERKKIFRTFIFCLALHLARWMKKFQILDKGSSNWEECCKKFMEQSKKSFCATCFVKLFLSEWELRHRGEELPDEIEKIKNCKWALPEKILELGEKRAHSIDINQYFTWEPCMCVKR